MDRTGALAWGPVPTPPMWSDPPFDRKPLGQQPNRFNRSMVVVVAILIGILVLGAAGLAISFFFDAGRVRSRRFEVRSGGIGLNAPGRDFNFSVVIPIGWDIEEWFPYDYDAMPGGEISGSEKVSGRFRITYTAVAPERGRSPIAGFEDRHKVWQEEVEDVEVSFFEPLEHVDQPGLRTGAILPALPRAPEGIEVLELHVFADRPTVEQSALVEKMIRSIRYERPPKKPDPYEPRASPGPDWTRVDARTGTSRGPNFSLLLPPGWTTTERAGYDSLVGTIEGDGISFAYELGSAHIIRGLETAGTQVLWYEEIDGEMVHFVRPWGRRKSPTLAAGAYFIRLPGSCYRPGVRSLVITAKGLTVEQQDLALAILKTVRDEDTGC